MKTQILFWIGTLIVIYADPSDAEQHTCVDTPFIEISSTNSSVLKDICEASGKAISFLKQYDLHPKRKINIVVTGTEINAHGYLAYGSFNRQEDLIRIMSLQAVLKNSDSPTMYGQPFDQEHYHGAIGHEIAHAVFHHNTGKIKDQLTNVTQEYLAHATQLGILSEERRTEIICSHDVGAWESGDSISDVYMGLRPTGFAVKSYLHLTQLHDPKPFVNILLNNNWFYVSVP